MFGVNYISFDSMTYVIHYSKGKIKREGRGLSFFYYRPSSSLTAIPLGTRDVPFIFKETSEDFQEITVQGQITYNISDPKALSEALDFTITSNKRPRYEKFEVLEQRLNNEAQTAVSSYIQGKKLKEGLRCAKEISEIIQDNLVNSKAVKLLGVQILSVEVLGVTPSPEMGKALETETRESLQKEADQAVYERRNFAVEQERKIRESELNTEIAVLLADSGNMYLGIGIRNKVCPIEGALSNMYLGGDKKLVKILVLNKNSNPVLPCGKCRDLLIHLGQQDALILFDYGSLKTMTMKELNPYYKDAERV